MGRIGKISWNKGLTKFTDKRIALYAEKRVGKKLSKEHIKKLSISHKGIKCTNGFKKGHITWNKGMRGFLAGSKHWHWKGGITSQDRLDRVRFRRTIQKEVLKRDNYTCQLCGQHNGKLQVDHIQSWSEYVELRFNINNCRTLCMECHYKLTFGKPLPKGIVWGHNLCQLSA